MVTVTPRAAGDVEIGCLEADAVDGADLEVRHQLHLCPLDAGHAVARGPAKAGAVPADRLGVGPA
jgi:hypothetical protein